MGCGRGSRGAESCESVTGLTRRTSHSRTVFSWRSSLMAAPVDLLLLASCCAVRQMLPSDIALECPPSPCTGAATSADVHTAHAAHRIGGLVVLGKFDEACHLPAVCRRRLQHGSNSRCRPRPVLVVDQLRARLVLQAPRQLLHVGPPHRRPLARRVHCRFGHAI